MHGKLAMAYTQWLWNLNTVLFIMLYLTACYIFLKGLHHSGDGTGTWNVSYKCGFEN